MSTRRLQDRTKSLTQEKFERFRETIRGAVTYKDMVSREIELSEQRLKTKEQQVKGKSINLMTLQTAIQEIEESEMDCDHSWATYSVNSNHYSTFNFTGKTNPLQSLQECIEGKAMYAIPGYP